VQCRAVAHPGVWLAFIAVIVRLVEAGCAKVSIADTIGVADPDAVRLLCEDALKVLPADKVAVHFHDTRGLGVANVMAALASGVEEFEGSIGGIGGCPFAPRSTGNVCSEDSLHMLELMGHRSGADMRRLLDVANWLEEALGKPLPGKLHRAGLEPWVAA